MRTHLFTLPTFKKKLTTGARKPNGAIRRQAGYTGIRYSFEQKLSIRVFLVILCTATLAFTIIAPTYHAFTLARQNLHDIQDYRLILDAATYISAERGPANIVMSEEPSSDSIGAKRLAEYRARTDAALARIATASDAPFGLHNHPVPTGLLARVRDRLAAARAKVDHVASRPRSPLKREEFQDAIESMFAVFDAFQAIVSWRADALVQHDSGLAAPVLVGQMLSDLREYGGRIGSEIIAPIATGERLPLKNVVDSRRSQRRLLELWHIIRSQSALYGNPSLAAGRAEIDRHFFGDSLGLIDRLIREGRQQGRYSMTATEFTERFVPTMRPIESYRRAFLDAAVERFVEARALALATLTTAVLVTSATVALLIGLILSIRIHIFRPLIHAHEEVRRLAEDRPAVRQPRPSQAGEILSLFQAIEVLQGKIEERATMTSELRVQAETDGLTGLLNRRMLDRLAQSPPGSADDKVCLILIDIDHFKAINDTYGHATGDRVLIQMAELLQSVLRASDVIARFGGEEFAVLVPGADLSGAITVARKVRIALQRARFTTPDGTPVRVTASFGVARGRRGQEAWPCLVELADEALYRAKSDGRNRVRFARRMATSDLAPSSHDARAPAAMDLGSAR
ncbi:GGDEF domain-containing protein [Methylobacterium nodulans]|uniref:diguanylate cyclase n=1 Tax=Methylobacterium nodulans (strain LMG 21967 / CNCM I-2342 / ORS 2060) TaxID=460265 RepID=B8IFL7_METNO|nr:GGDEF domain-containing protein [Methylobacterium nodulans]ACL57752.1 diguanylate cyclase [Methylobacterium nodulans ORS 2060]